MCFLNEFLVGFGVRIRFGVRVGVSVLIGNVRLFRFVFNMYSGSALGLASGLGGGVSLRRDRSFVRPGEAVNVRG